LQSFFFQTLSQNLCFLQHFPKFSFQNFCYFKFFPENSFRFSFRLFLSDFLIGFCFKIF
jgi:hypothetical protein